MTAIRADEGSHFQPEWLMGDPQSIGDAVITSDKDGKVTSLNRVAETLTGWVQAEAIGASLESIFKIINHETRTIVESPTVRALQEGVIVGLPDHTLLIARDGKEHPIGPIDHSVTPIRNHLGELTGAVLVFRDVTNQKIQEQRVRTALAYAENIIATLREPFLVLDESLRIKTANRAFYKTFHVEKKGTEGCLIFDLGKGRWDVTQLRGLLEEVLADHDPIHDFEVEIAFPGIGKKVMLLNARRFGSIESQPDLILLAIEDITERRQAEDGMRRTEQRQRFILDSLPQKITTTRPDGSVDYFNLQWMEYTGLPFEQIEGFGWKEFIHPEDADDHVRGWLNAITISEVFEHESRFRRGDGEYRWHISRGVPIRDANDQIIMWVGANTDIHEIKQAEIALKGSEMRYRRLFETAKDGILILDNATGRINDANPFMSELLGYPHEHFLGKELWEIGLFSDRSANEGAVKTLQKSGYIRYEHLPLETNLGKRVEVEIVANSYEEDHHAVIQCNIRDITDRSRLEKQLQDQAAALADLDRRKDEFLAMLSHELRNPLAPITNAVQILELQKNNETKLQGRARTIIERQVGQLTRLVDDLLEVSRITTGRIHLQRERVGLNRVVERALETVRPLMDQRRHQLTVLLSPQPIWLDADPARLEQVVVNLLTNAAKYTPECGEISISVQGNQQDAVLRVKDSGVGIAPELLTHVFDLFTQAERSLDRSEGGLGIGLCLVQRLVEMHGGKVEVASQLGAGSEFIVHLPILSPTASVPEVSGEVNDGFNPHPLRILVVDDNLDAAESLTLLLAESGHEVQSVSDGYSAVKAAVSFLPNVVLLDIGLPGIDGYEVARRLREDPALAGMVLVAMTGYGQISDNLRSQNAGFDHHLVKPVDFGKVKKILASIPGP